MTAEDDREKSMEYLDLLAATLTQHEKALDSLIEKLEKASDDLERVSKQERARTKPKVRTPRGEAPEVLTYTKIEIPYDRPVEELTKILEALTARKTTEEK